MMKLSTATARLQNVIDKNLQAEEYETVSYFSKTPMPFDWPLAEEAVKTGLTAYVMNFDAPKISRENRHKVYAAIRKHFKSHGWTNVYFESIVDKVYVALVQRK
jgi:hypothetical protein